MKECKRQIVNGVPAVEVISWRIIIAIVIAMTVYYMGFGMSLRVHAAENTTNKGILKAAASDEDWEDNDDDEEDGDDEGDEGDEGDSDDDEEDNEEVAEPQPNTGAR